MQVKLVWKSTLTVTESNINSELALSASKFREQLEQLANSILATWKSVPRTAGAKRCHCITNTARANDRGIKECPLLSKFTCTKPGKFTDHCFWYYCDAHAGSAFEYEQNELHSHSIEVKPAMYNKIRTLSTSFMNEHVFEDAMKNSEWVTAIYYIASTPSGCTSPLDSLKVLLTNWSFTPTFNGLLVICAHVYVIYIGNHSTHLAEYPSTLPDLPHVICWLFSFGCSLGVYMDGIQLLLNAFNRQLFLGVNGEYAMQLGDSQFTFADTIPHIIANYDSSFFTLTKEEIK